MHLEQLRYFLSVARHRNFTEAAREFYMTQPAITHQISALERELGAKLFLRTTRNVSLTRAGELFLEDAKRMLRALSGKTHQVHTGVCIAKGDRAEHFVDSCKVTFFPLGEEEIELYTTTPEPYDKAGAYAIQGRAALWLDRIEGDYYTIMGLPVSRTVQLLAHFL